MTQESSQQEGADTQKPLLMELNTISDIKEFADRLFPENTNEKKLEQFLRDVKELAEKSGILMAELDFQKTTVAAHLDEISQGRVIRTRGRPRKDRNFLTTGDIAPYTGGTTDYLRRVLNGDEINPSILYYGGILRALEGKMVVFVYKLQEGIPSLGFGFYERMRRPQDLTSSQFKMLYFLSQYIEEYGTSPSPSKIQQEMGYKNALSVGKNFSVLADRGYITTGGLGAENIQLVPDMIKRIMV